MIRLVRSLALTSLLLSLPMSASALGISITGVTSSTGTTTLFAGDTITVDLVVENDANEDVTSLGLVATGYDTDRNGLADSGLAFQSGAVSNGLFGALRTINPSTGEPFGSLLNIRTAPVEQWLFDNFNPQALRTSFYVGAETTPSSGSGGDDLGIGGGYVGDGGDVHFQLTFVAGATAPGLTSQLFNMNFGTSAEDGQIAVGVGGSVLAFNNASLGITVIPEPGTALLMGLGLMSLAARRR